MYNHLELLSITNWSLRLDGLVSLFFLFSEHVPIYHPHSDGVLQSAALPQAYLHRACAERRSCEMLLSIHADAPEV